MIEVGQKVRVVESPIKRPDCEVIGKVYTVTHSNGRGLLRLDDPKAFLYHARWLEKVEGE